MNQSESAVSKMLNGRRGRDGSLRLSAYYYSFEPTGVESIDRILSAVACAGKSYHHTEYWTEPNDEVIWDGDPETVPQINEGVMPSWAEIIQQAANEAASAVDHGE